jgi:hypothetical protein
MHKRFYPLLYLALIVLLSIAISLFKPPKVEAESTVQYCLSCHNDPNLFVILANGEKLSLFISSEAIVQSIHSNKGIECNACHTTITSYPHPKLEYQSRRELSRAYYLACQNCHSINYYKTLDSYHGKVAAQGNLAAPICTDCHGSHNINFPDKPRSLISTTCGQCHKQIFDEYKKSIHGKALTEENNPDVPVCTDCHGVHNIQDPRTAQFRLETPELCAKCHADPKLMSKYGLTSDVYTIYKLSWHGVDASVYKARWPTIWHDSAVCIDCHGIHNIRATNDPQSSVNPTNLLTTCRKCHPNVGPNWTGAWTGHNKISLQKTPFLFYANAFYTSFIPYVLWISIIYVGLQIIRSIVGRVRRGLQ